MQGAQAQDGASCPANMEGPACACWHRSQAAALQPSKHTYHLGDEATLDRLEWSRQRIQLHWHIIATLALGLWDIPSSGESKSVTCKRYCRQVSKCQQASTASQRIGCSMRVQANVIQLQQLQTTHLQILDQVHSVLLDIDGSKSTQYLGKTYDTSIQEK